MFQFLVLCSMGIITVSGTMQVFEAPNLSNSQPINVNVHSEIPAYITWNTTKDTVFSIHVQDDMVNGQLTDGVNNLEVKFEHNVTHVLFEVNNPEPIIHNMTIIRDVALTSSRGNRTILDVGQFFILLWLSALAGNWKHIFIVSTIFIGSLAAHLLGKTFAQGDDKRRLVISIFAPRYLSYRSISLVTQDGKIRYNDNATNVECMAGLHRDNHTGCKQCCHGNGLCSNNMCLCDNGYDENTYCQVKKRINVLFKHPLDPRLLFTKLSSGEEFRLNVVQDVATGTIRPKMVTRMTSEQGAFQMEFDKNGQIKRISQMNGKNKANLLIATSKGCEVRIFSKMSRYNKQLLKILSLDICKSNMAALSKASQSSDFAMYTSNLNKLKMLFYGEQDRESSRNSTISEKYIHVKVKVENCKNQRVDGEVHMNIESANDPESSPVRINIPAFRSHDGGYFFRLPNISSSFATEFEEKCKGVSGIIKSICFSPLIAKKQLICSDLNDSVRVRSNVSEQDIESSCRNLFDSIEKYCNPIKTNEWNFKGDCIENYDEARNIFKTDELELKPVVTFVGGKVINKFHQRISLQNISLLGASDIKVTDDKPEFKIIGVTVTPKDPLPLDLYQVRLDYACATNFTMIDMRISGSDLYSNFATCPGLNPCSCCVLHAAGAAGTVVDNIVINITDPWVGTSITKTVVVVF